MWRNHWSICTKDLSWLRAGIINIFDNDIPDSNPLIKEVKIMIDFIISLFSSVYQMDIRDHHNIPFALPLIICIITGLSIGLPILKLIGNKKDCKNTVQ